MQTRAWHFQRQCLFLFFKCIMPHCRTSEIKLHSKWTVDHQACTQLFQGVYDHACWWLHTPVWAFIIVLIAHPFSVPHKLWRQMQGSSATYWFAERESREAEIPFIWTGIIFKWKWNSIKSLSFIDTNLLNPDFSFWGTQLEFLPLSGKQCN